MFHNFGSTGKICKIFTFLEIALKFVSSFSLPKERNIKSNATRASQKLVHRGRNGLIVDILAFGGQTVSIRQLKLL